MLNLNVLIYLDKVMEKILIGFNFWIPKCQINLKYANESLSELILSYLFATISLINFFQT
jgi:hypothetical protein